MIPKDAHLQRCHLLASVTCLLHAFKECCPGGRFGSSWGGVLQFLLPCLRSAAPVRVFFFLPCRARHDSSDGRSRLHTIRTQFKRVKDLIRGGSKPNKQPNNKHNTQTKQKTTNNTTSQTVPKKLRSRR